MLGCVLTQINENIMKKLINVPNTKQKFKTCLLFPSGGNTLPQLTWLLIITKQDFELVYRLSKRPESPALASTQALLVAVHCAKSHDPLSLLLLDIRNRVHYQWPLSLGDG